MPSNTNISGFGNSFFGEDGRVNAKFRQKFEVNTKQEKRLADLLDDWLGDSGMDIATRLYTYKNILLKLKSGKFSDILTPKSYTGYAYRGLSRIKQFLTAHESEMFEQISNGDFELLLHDNAKRYFGYIAFLCTVHNTYPVTSWTVDLDTARDFSLHTGPILATLIDDNAFVFNQEFLDIRLTRVHNSFNPEYETLLFGESTEGVLLFVPIVVEFNSPEKGTASYTIELAKQTIEMPKSAIKNILTKIQNNDYHPNTNIDQYLKGNK